MTLMNGTNNMDDSFKEWLENALAHYDKEIGRAHV